MKQAKAEPQPAQWPFPPKTGPVPWTPKQIAEYNRKQLEKMQEAPF